MKRTQLQRDSSMLTFESAQSLGASSITQKLVVRHHRISRAPGDRHPVRGERARPYR